jgi:hypothetical protein
VTSNYVGVPSWRHRARNKWRARAGAETHRGPPLNAALDVIENANFIGRRAVGCRITGARLLEEFRAFAKGKAKYV